MKIHSTDTGDLRMISENTDTDTDVWIRSVMASQDISYPNFDTKDKKFNENAFTIIGTWTLRGPTPEKQDIENILERKIVDICAFQEKTKIDEFLDPENQYQKILFGRSS